VKKKTKFINKNDLALNLFGGDVSSIAIQWIIRWFFNEAIEWERNGRVKATPKYQPHRTPIEVTIDTRTHHLILQKKSYYLVKGQQAIQTRVVRLNNALFKDISYACFVDLSDCESGGIITTMMVAIKEARLSKDGAGNEIDMDLLTAIAKDIRSFLLRKQPEQRALTAYVHNL
jgi:hypothetical protein